MGKQAAPPTRRATPNPARHYRPDTRVNGEPVFDPVLTMVEVAQRLGVSRATVYAQLNDPEFVTFRIGRQRRMRESVLQAWIQLQEITGA
jgi:excisionase family DNA binding protein